MSLRSWIMRRLKGGRPVCMQAPPLALAGAYPESVDDWTPDQREALRIPRVKSSFCRGPIDLLEEKLARWDAQQEQKALSALSRQECVRRARESNHALVRARREPYADYHHLLTLLLRRYRYMDSARATLASTAPLEHPLNGHT